MDPPHWVSQIEITVTSTVSWDKSGRRPKDLIRSFWQKTLKQKTLAQKTLSLGPALAGPSTLNPLLHALNCTAFASASAADNILPTGPGPRAV